MLLGLLLILLFMFRYDSMKDCHMSELALLLVSIQAADYHKLYRNKPLSKKRRISQFGVVCYLPLSGFRRSVL